MNVIRAGQRGLTAVLPHQANRRIAIPIRRNEEAPVVPEIFEITLTIGQLTTSYGYRQVDGYGAVDPQTLWGGTLNTLRIQATPSWQLGFSTGQPVPGPIYAYDSLDPTVMVCAFSGGVFSAGGQTSRKALWTAALGTDITVYVSEFPFP